MTGKQLRALGFPEGPVVSVAMQEVAKNFPFEEDSAMKVLLKQVLDNPEAFLDHPGLGKTAAKLWEDRKPVSNTTIALLEKGVPFSVYGTAQIEETALHQMHQAVKLPIAVAGALMPDAHSGYGLPIGGVLATENAVIPYGVGVDIGCRMCLSVFPVSAAELHTKEKFFTRELGAATLFGSGAQFSQAADHEVMEDPAFDELPLLRQLQGKAWKQLGTSGSGNHFAEFGIVQVPETDSAWPLPAGTYVGLLTHSGSRGLGASIATHYTKLAKEQRQLPKDAANLAWLLLTEPAGAEYWMAMNLAGQYASACHEVIHDKMARQLGMKPLARVENHHNFAWKEWIDGRELIVHRKGATPAGKDVLGIIPGSMTANGYIVKGRGEPSSLFSAAHGAGRKMSRTRAMQSLTKDDLRKMLEQYGVILLGGGLDEAPQAYKDISTVMQAQTDLVDIIGTFTPKIVKMDG